MIREHAEEHDDKLEFVSFQVAQKDFCIAISAVKEIRGWTRETVLPHVPDFVRGVINLRGTVLSILDLTERFGFGIVEPNDRNVIIIVEVEDQLVGLLVDSVSDIFTVAADVIQPTPNVGEEVLSQFSRGLVAVENKMLCIVDLASIVSEIDRNAA